MVVRTTNWRTRSGKLRTIRLYNCWRNMLARVKGRHVDGNGDPRWKGLEVGFRDWQHFREWSLANGFRKGLVLDRKDEALGYVPENCQWITKAENALKAAAAHQASCMCWHCKRQKT